MTAKRNTGAVVVAALSALFFVYPVTVVLGRSAGADAIREVLGDQRIRAVAWFSLWQAAASTLLATVAGVIVASALQRANGTTTDRSSRAASLTLGLLAAPFTLPTVVVGTAFLAAAPSSFRTSPWLIIAAHVYFNIGYLARAVFGALTSIPITQRHAAQALGATPMRSLLTVELPLVRRTIRSAAGVVFALCFASFGTVLILGGPRRSTLDVEIYRQALQYGRLDRSAVVAVAQLLVLTFVLLITKGQTVRTTVTSGGARRASGPSDSSRKTNLQMFAMLAAATAWTITPLAGIVARAFRNRNGSVGLDNARALRVVTPASGLIAAPLESVSRSLAQAFIVSGFAIICTLMIIGVRYTPFGRGVGRFLTVGPLAISPIMLGLGVLIGFSHAPLQWRAMWFMVPALQTIICLPFTLAILGGAAEALPASTGDVSATLGASPLQSWRTVILPLLRRPLANSFGTAFAVALGEFGAASLLVQPARETMPVAIARLAGKPGAVFHGQAALLSLILATCTIMAASLTVNFRSPTNLRG